MQPANALMTSSQALPPDQPRGARVAAADNWKERYVPRARSTQRQARARGRRLWTIVALSTVLYSLLATSERTLAQPSSETRPLTPADVAVLRSCATPLVSPNGQHIAFHQYVPRDPFSEPDGPARSHLYVVNTAGHLRPMVIGDDSVSSIAWSPNGDAIYYLARRGDDQHTCLYRLPLDGGESRRVAHLKDTSISGFSIHPQESKVALVAVEPLDAAERRLREQGFNQQIFEEDWRYSRVWIRPLQLRDVFPSRPLAALHTDNAADTEHQLEPLAIEGSVSFVQWNHTGDRLLVVVAPTPSVDDSYMKKKVAVVDPATAQIVAQVDHAAKLGEVGWSPDDTHIAMIAGRDLHDPREGRLMVVNIAAGNKPRDLMPDYAAHVHDFCWLDTDKLLWAAGEGTLSRVGTITLDGKREDILVPDPDTGIIQAVDANNGGDSIAVLAHSRRHPSEVYRLNLQGKSLTRLTNANPWLDQRRFARQETIRWKAGDGLELEGVLIYPLDYEPGRRYPLIVLVHGGPESHESDGWLTSYSRPGQVGAARQFFVFYPNYRGSTGRGVEFSMMGQADAAGKEFSDIVDGVDHLIAQGLVDKKRVGITGGSYGGYASAWAATYYSDRFAASVMFVGISDNISKVGTTDIPEEMFLVHHRKRLWDDWEYFLRTSPIRYVQRNQTPTLILHGKEDPRVHPSQSLELHRHLKTLNQAPVRLVFYEGEGHGNRKAAARIDYNLRMLRWMERFLKEDAQTPPPPQIDYRAALGLPSDEENDQTPATADAKAVLD